MDPYTDLLNQQRKLTPPSGVVDQLEQRVMARLDHLPRERRRKLTIVGGASLCCALVILVVLVAIRPRAKPSRPPDFVESVVLLDDHTCIWLDRTESNHQRGHFHE